MVSSLSYSPFSYLDQLQAIKPVAGVTPAPAEPTPPSTETAETSVTNAKPAAPLAKNPLQLPANVLSLLQEFSSDSSNDSFTASLFGVSSKKSAPAFYDTLQTNYNAASKLAAYNGTVQRNSALRTDTSPVQDVLQRYNSARNASNAYYLKAAQAALTPPVSTPISLVE